MAELRQIRQLLERQALRAAFTPTLPDKVKISVSKFWHVLGQADAPVTIVEFTDLQCPYCQRFHKEVFPRLREEYIDSGKVRFVSLDLPLANHTQAFKAAEAIRCADEQGKFWELRSAILAGAEQPDEDNVVKTGKMLGLDVTKFRACLTSGRYKREVDQEINEAAIAEVHGTPTFVVSRTSQDLLEGSRISGFSPFALFQGKIEEILKQLSESRSVQ